MAQSWRHVAQSDADMAAAMQVSGIINRQVKLTPSCLHTKFLNAVVVAHGGARVFVVRVWCSAIW